MGGGLRCSLTGGEWGEYLHTGCWEQGAGGCGGWAGGWGAGREQTIRGSGNKDQILGVGGGRVGGPKRETRGAIGDPGVRDEGIRGPRGKQQG